MLTYRLEVKTDEGRMRVDSLETLDEPGRCREFERAVEMLMTMVQRQRAKALPVLVTAGRADADNAPDKQKP